MRHSVLIARMAVGVLGAMGFTSVVPFGFAASDARPEFECVDRPHDVSPPPTRLAPKIRRKAREYGKTGGAITPPGSLGMKPLCRTGKVPMQKNVSADITRKRVEKGNPLLGQDAGREMLQLEGDARGEFIRRHVRTFEEVYKAKRPAAGREAPPAPPGPPGAPACDGVLSFGSCYYYGSAAFSTVADGGGMIASIETPQYVNSGGSGHSLDELAIQGGEGNGNIIEIGWLVSTEQYGNANPHIFVFHWKNWNPTCYDACGWVQWSNTYHPAQDLRSVVGKKVYIGYVLWQGNWWAWFDNQWMGYLPGTEWDGKYTKTSLIQWFGEVASQNGIPPKTDMGNGLFSNAAKAASMTALCDVDAKAWVCWYRDRQTVADTVPAYYDIRRVAFGAVRYGGAGE